jgi:peroxiredoxin
MGQTTVLVTVLAVLGLVVSGLAAVLFQVIKQQGRLLLRLDQLEKHLGLSAGQAIERGTVALQAQDPEGLPVGTALPDFELPDLEGRRIALEGFRGRRVLLVNWSARCGFCDLIAPELAKLEPELEKAGVQLLLVSSGTEEAERESAGEHGLKSPILFQKDTNALEAFAHQGTPSAYLLDEEGKVARPLAVGSTDVLALAEALMPEKLERKKRLPGERPLSESRIERNGLKPGTPAPVFELPDVRGGGTVSLAERQGKKVLLVFSDPHCGPCEELAPHLIRLHEQHRNNGLDLVLVGRGGPEENRQKAEEHGFEFPMVVQKKWELSKEYGIFATPVGFLIDERGVIERGVARGIEEILALAPDPVRREAARV